MLSLPGVLASLIVTATISVASPDFPNNAMVPTKFTCEGDNLSPALHLGETPLPTKTLAIIMYDADAGKGGYTHWVVWNIKRMQDIPIGFHGGVHGINSSGQSGYLGPCPQSGVHHYHFIVYALDEALELDAHAGRADLEKAMQGHILAQGETVGWYKKLKQGAGSN